MENFCWIKWLRNYGSVFWRKKKFASVEKVFFDSFGEARSLSFLNVKRVSIELQLWHFNSGCSVLLNHRVHAVVGVLSDDTDPMVTVMKLEKAPQETYADIGGLDQQIQVKSEFIWSLPKYQQSLSFTFSILVPNELDKHLLIELVLWSGSGRRTQVVSVSCQVFADHRLVFFYPSLSFLGNQRVSWASADPPGVLRGNGNPAAKGRHPLRTTRNRKDPVGQSSRQPDVRHLPQSCRIGAGSNVCFDDSDIPCRIIPTFWARSFAMQTSPCASPRRINELTHERPRSSSSWAQS